MELTKPNFPEFLPEDEGEVPPTPEPKSDEIPPEEAFLSNTERLPIKVVGGNNMHDLLLKAGPTLTLDFLVKISPESFLGDHLLIGYVQLSSYLEFKKLGKTYKTEDPALFKQWLSLKEFGGSGTTKDKK